LEHKLTKENYTLYSAKKEEARINEEKDRAQFANVTVASRPTVPITPWFPQRGKIMLLSLPLALMLALTFSAMSYAMEQRLWTPTDVSLHTKLRILGTLDTIGPVGKPAYRNSGLGPSTLRGREA
jgi:capsular polysaccharide biosynthesis protein